jgi:hypothetical protein
MVMSLQDKRFELNSAEDDHADHLHHDQEEEEVQEVPEPFEEATTE